ncbi:signal peptidase I/inner membrane protease subunit 2 [Marininema mesophilum]|uniref:Signal peptidase I n=1 Tax=Marininema mesophilum TaxID=1048340 RepID=A0A1H2XB28_9BACL|nr:signal peptidase I [Marininema mesophilum]SDW90103.1 signal peptidase I/inner membrane protease subunit 2 [Marininema mesophilum]
MEKIVKIAIAIWSGMILIALFLFSFFDWSVITGSSMKPTFQSHDVILLQSNPKPSEIEKGDIITFQTKKTSIPYIKRVAALTGDQVEEKNQRIYVNSQPIRNCGWQKQKVSSFPSIYIPEQHIFVLGDNLTQSIDSRTLGPISYQAVDEKVVAIIWPLSRFHLFK